MSKFVLTNVRLFAGGTDLTTFNNQVALSAEGESKETTAFAASGDVWHEEITGIKSVSLNASGQWDAGDLTKPDDDAFTNFGTVGAISVCPAGAADAALAYLTQYNRRQYQLLGAVGDVAPWSWQSNGSWPLVRGSVLATPSARTTTGTGTAVQLGAVSATQHVYLALHVFSVSGSTPSLTVAIQSDNANNFPSPATVDTFTAANSIGSQIRRVAGAITDDWYRVSYTITGSSPSFLFAVTAGIAV